MQFLITTLVYSLILDNRTQWPIHLFSKTFQTLLIFEFSTVLCCCSVLHFQTYNRTLAANLLINFNSDSKRLIDCLQI